METPQAKRLHEVAAMIQMEFWRKKNRPLNVEIFGFHAACIYVIFRDEKR